MYNTRRLLQATLFIILIIVAAVLYFWLQIFSDQPLSEDPADWSAFANYFGGMLNPIIAIANLVFLIYISFQLATREDQRSLNNLRHEAIQSAVKALDTIPNPIFGLEKGDAVLCGKACDDFSKFCLGYIHLFASSVVELREMETFLFAFSGKVNRYFVLRATTGRAEDAAELLQELESIYMDQFRSKSTEVMRRLTETFVRLAV